MPVSVFFSCLLAGLPLARASAQTADLILINGNLVTLDERRPRAEAQVRRLAERLTPGEWITGSQWHTGNWDRQEWPTRRSLDEAAPRNPVFLGGMHSHASWASSLALQLYSIVEKSLRARFNVAIHAIGDRGNQMALDAVEEALRRVPVADHRIRIEHAQIVRPQDLPRFARLGVLASVQWIHSTLDMPWAEKRVGPERIRGGYAWRTLLNLGTRLVGGSDEGAATFSPFMGIHAAVTRQDAKGWPAGGWYPEQRLTPYEALKSYTLDAAYASFEEDVLGSLTPGKYADLIVLSKDVLTVPPEEILATQAVMTLVGGKVVFERR